MSRFVIASLSLLVILLLLRATSGLAQTPVINEFMASNATTIADEDGDFSDWIELYNPGASDYDLTGCYLSDDETNPLRWQFPGATLPAGGFLLIWASGKDRVGSGGELHTNFAISASGEPLLLTGADGVTLLDGVEPVALATDVSYGRSPDGAALWVTFGVPTPGAANAGSLLHLEAPVFSTVPGFYPSAITLAVTATDPEAEIRYTLDGSEPTLASPLYEAPLVLDSRAGDPNVISLIPTNFVQSGHYAWRPPRVEIFKLNVLRARAFRAGHTPSAVTTGSYIIDPDPAAQLPLAVVSLATSHANMFDDEIGLYVPGNTYVPGDFMTGNYFQDGEDWERPVHVEIFDLQGDRLLAQGAGMRMHGGLTRHYPQKTLRMYARAMYGESSFDAAIFPDQPYVSYKRFLIRNSGNDWGYHGFRDLVIQTMCADMGFDTQAGRPVVHFVNGEYWGLANLRERFDAHYIERRYGVPRDAVAMLVDNAWVQEGSQADRADYLALRQFVITNDMSDPANLAHVAEQMDLANYIAYNVAEIFIANRDWPSNNVRFWRRTPPVAEPGAPYGHDGRWRWLMFDVDYSYALVDHNTLAAATDPDGPDWPNPPWSTELLRGLLENEWFRHSFINSFADHLNSTFIPARLIGFIDVFADLYAPAIADHYDRWDITRNWEQGLQMLRNYSTGRPAHQRQHISDHFELGGLADLTIAVNHPGMGKVQVNQLIIDADLPGLADPLQPYPWHGIYFQDVPITVTALPGAGHRFVAWQETGDADPILTVTPGPEPIGLTAVFAVDESQPVALHAWHFNDLAEGALDAVAADLSLLGGAVLTYPGTGPGYLDRVDPGTELGALPDTPAGLALRVRNPADTRELFLTLPSTGHEDLVLSYAVMRTSNGAEEHAVHCQVAASGPWHLLAASVPVSEEYQYFAHDLAGVADAADNPDLVVKFTFGGANAAGASGNQRFDNLTLTGVALPGANLPPQVVAPVALQSAIERGAALTVDLADVFVDPEGDPLAYVAVSAAPDVASVSVTGSAATITPLARGDAWITVTAVDGHNAPVDHAFRVLVYPEAAVLADGGYSFTEWDPDLPEHTYPAHMLFLQSAVDDPGIDEPLLHPYWIAHDDYHADDQGTIGYPYNNTGRTRINGLGEEGISFINTGRGRDLGGALLALDTRGLLAAEVGWLGGTILPNSRIYAIRLQHRVGITGAFSDVLIDGAPVQYLRSEAAGDVAVLGPHALPAELLDHAHLQLLWRYYHVEVTSGPRAELRLDELQVAGIPDSTSTEPDLPLPRETALHGNVPNPFNPATEILLSVRQGETGRLEIYDSRGRLVRSLGRYPAGQHRVTWDGSDAAGQRCASGVYFYRLNSASGSWTGKMALVK
jgi:hypothetical protein